MEHIDATAARKLYPNVKGEIYGATLFSGFAVLDMGTGAHGVMVAGNMVACCPNLDAAKSAGEKASTRIVYVIRRKRMKNDGVNFTMEWLTRKNGIIEFSSVNKIGNRGGHAVANQATWKTQAGAERVMKDYASYMEAAAKIGPIEIVAELQ